MKGAALAVMLTFVGAFALTQPAHAVVCAKGVYRAGCAGPNGAAVVRRPYGYHGGAAVVRGPNGRLFADPAAGLRSGGIKPLRNQHPLPASVQRNSRFSPGTVVAELEQHVAPRQQPFSALSWLRELVCLA